MPSPRAAVLAVAATAAAAVLLGAAGAKPPPPEPWAHRPSEAQMAAALPGGVKPEGGWASMLCKVQPDGDMADCRLTRELPSGKGLGAALLSLAPQYRLNLATASTKPGEEIAVSHSWFDFDTPPDWLRKPTASQIMRIWPTQAWARGLSGKATVTCLISVQGALFDCEVASETPAGEHFGDAALALTPQFLMRPATLKGQPVVSPVNVPISFYMPPGVRPPPGPKGGDMAVATMAWLEAPSYAAVAAAYPPKAKAAGLGGRATLACEFDKQGRLGHCQTLAEEPKHEGFADAARALAKDFRAPERNADGRPLAGASLELPVVFDPAMLATAAPVVGKPQWVGLPSGEDATAAFGKLGLSGTSRAVLACVVQQGGTVSDCRVASETPAGQGLGAAALGLAPHFRLTTWTAEGLPTVGATIDIPLRYEPGEAAPAPCKKITEFLALGGGGLRLCGWTRAPPGRARGLSQV